METLSIPSPTAFLSSPVLQPANLSTTSPSSHRRKSSTVTKQTLAEPPKKPAGVQKPKQSKSRNGCITCKAKRLKCDETKPTCQQCHKRTVSCGGYKKDFKWRPFEETTLTNKVVPPQQKRTSISQPKPHSPPDPAGSPSHSETSGPTENAELEVDAVMQDTFFNAAIPSPSTLNLLDSSFLDHSFPSTITFDMSTPPYLREQPRNQMFEPNSVTSSLESLFEETHIMPTLTSRSSISGQSPKLVDLLQPGSHLSPLQIQGSSSQAMNGFDFQSTMMHDPMLDEDIEEIIRQQPTPSDMWMGLRSPRTRSRSGSGSPTCTRDDPFSKIYRQPEVQAGSPEMLMLRFDKQTCGILSVKDGPTENPWRTLIWPLARDSPALYHAIASLTAFHTSKEKPALRVDGMEHMRRSIRSLATGIEKMRTDTALATTLVLAFSESWDQHISTGIEHLRGAKILVNQALIKHNRRALVGDDLARLKFLCNTWVYMDVIARLTSVDEDVSDDFDIVLAPLSGPFGNHTTEVDPLMGCASTLFPLIGRAANLCRRVLKSESNSIAIISQAIELKEQIEQWQPGSAFEAPEDPSAEIQHALQTAESYRYATLLYLHQAVPEIPSLTSAQLAKKVLVYLATVPLSSRLVIVQIYPLLAAGCEAYEREDRKWVQDRWTAMAQRMWIGNIDKCWIVTREVWKRRDSAEANKEALKLNQRRPTIMHSESSKRKFEEEMEDIFSFSEMLNGAGQGGQKRQRQTRPAPPPQRKKAAESITEELDPEMTVRGNLHWVGVMKDWEWEVLLG